MENTNTPLELKSLEPLYLEGKYEEVIEGLSLLRSELDPGLFHYNMGTIYSRLEDLGGARYHLEKARVEGYFTTELQNNLQYVVERLAIEDLTLSPVWSDRLIGTLVGLPLELYLTITLLGLCLLFVWHKWRPFAKVWAPSVFLILCLSPVGLGIFVQSYETAIVLEDSQLREGPSAIYEDKGLMPAGAKVLLGQGHNGWYFIERPNTFSGWVHEDVLGFLSTKD